MKPLSALPTLISIFLSALLLTLPFASASSVHILFNGQEQGRPVQVSPQNPVSRTITISHDPADITWSRVRVKIDVVPGRRNTVWFTPTLLGDFDIQCTVICGVNHSAMLSKVRVVSEAEFKEWYFSDEAAPRVPAAAAPAAGKEPPIVGLLRGKSCLACHSLDGSPMVGPTFKGLYGSRQTLLIDGERRSAVMDGALLRKAISRPGSVQVLGYPPIMPPAKLSDEEMEDIVAYLRSL